MFDKWLRKSYEICIPTIIVLKIKTFKYFELLTTANYYYYYYH